MEGYGGTERVCYWLAKAQAEMGHEVTVLCRPGSRLSFARIIEIPEKIEHAGSFLPPGIEVVQVYQNPNFQIDHPLLVNIGGNGQAGEKFHPNTVFVSRNHAERHGWTEFVYNGIDVSEYPLRRGKSDYLLFLAKASWRVKNLSGAIRIARAAGMTLAIGGGRAACWQRGVRSHGMVDGPQKLRLLQDARALLFPVIWNEPFGLVTVEALACGTPVIATPRGALPEILTSEVGVLADSFHSLVEGVERTKRISPEACRAHVENNFTHRHMAARYEEYYKKILSDGKLRIGFPMSAKGADPQEKILYSGYRTRSNFMKRETADDRKI